MRCFSCAVQDTLLTSAVRCQELAQAAFDDMDLTRIDWEVSSAACLRARSATLGTDAEDAGAALRGSLRGDSRRA